MKIREIDLVDAVGYYVPGIHDQDAMAAAVNSEFGTNYDAADVFYVWARCNPCHCGEDHLFDFAPGMAGRRGSFKATAIGFSWFPAVESAP